MLCILTSIVLNVETQLYYETKNKTILSLYMFVFSDLMWGGHL